MSVPMVCLTLCMSVSFFERGLYNRVEVVSTSPNWRKIALAWSQSVAVAALLTFCLAWVAESVSYVPEGMIGTLRGPWLPTVLFAGFGTISAARYGYAKIKVAQLPLNRTVLVGEPEPMDDLLRHVETVRRSGFDIVGVFKLDDDPPHAVAPVRHNFLGLPQIGGLEALERMIRCDGVDTVLIAVPWSNTQRARAIIRRVSMAPVYIYIYPGMDDLNIPSRRAAAAFELPLLMACAKPIDGWGAFMKRAEDIILTLGILLFISPAMLTIAVLIKLTSPGPVLFRQQRIGYNNRVIRVLKFRSMYTHLTDADASVQAFRGDKRVTPLGVWLRKYSLDELPQLFNVLGGDMSLVGPRPHALATTAGGLALEDAVPTYASRHRVKPGITGWAQVNGYRGALDSVEKIVHRVNHDLYYIENWSLSLDLKILWLTFRRIFADDNAF